MDLKPMSKRGESALNVPTKVMGVIFGLVILGFLIVVVAGNLRTSTGFDTGSDDYNVTENIMRNTTRGVAEFFSNIGTIFTILFVVVIIALIMIVWAVSRKATGTTGRSSL